MTIWNLLIWAGLILAATPVMMTLTNALFFRRLPRAAADTPKPAVSVLIPARNEERSIAGAVRSVLASRAVDLELIVLDDDSTDGTARIVHDLAASDGRVRLIRGGPLPGGWCGKQYACRQLADAATHDLLVWIDADVTLAPDALRRMADRVNRTDVAMLSGFPYQVTETWLEKWIVPLIHVLLLGYLPMFFMRFTRHPGFGVGCGQLVMIQREPYKSIGGHEAVRASLHDGITLPRAFRRRGFMTDVFDATDAARCRMYRDAGEVWRGFVKNATEGMATTIGLPVWTALLFGGFVLPWLLLVLTVAQPMWFTPDQAALVYGSVGPLLVHGLACRLWLRHDWQSIFARPLGIVVLLAIQWTALIRHWRGQPAVWKDRPQQLESA